MFTLFGYTFAGLSGAYTLLLAVGATVALVAMYLLRERQRRIMVPFSPLWTEALGTRVAERMGRRLRRWLSFLLQLTILFLLLFAAANPRPKADLAAGRTFFILVDRSASMGAFDGSGTRLATAKQRVRDIVGGLHRGDHAMVASFAAAVTAESGLESDPSVLRSAVDRISATDEPANLGVAVTFASSVLRGRPSSTLIIVGDGDYDEAAAASKFSLDGVDVRVARVGASGDNVAILSFTAQRRTFDPSTVEIGFTVENFGTNPRQVVLQIAAGAQRRPVDRLPLILAPHERITKTLPWLSSTEAELEARLTFEGPGPLDLLPVDNQAFAVVPAIPARRILLVGGTNLYLEGALLSFGDTVAVERVSADRATELRPKWPVYDAVIFDAVAPGPAPTSGRYVYLGPRGDGSPFADRGAVQGPTASDVNKRHPLIAHVSLADLNIKEARRLSLVLPGDEAVVSSFGTPLLLTRQRPGLKVVALSFDIRRSDLPLRPALPLLLANILDWLSDEKSGFTAGHRTGTVARVTLPSGANGARITDPAGRIVSVAASGGGVDLPMPHQGIYRVQPEGRDGGSAIILAANLEDPAESDTQISETRAPSAAAWQDTNTRPPVSPGAPAVLLAVVLLLFEWWSFNRRWTV